MKNKAYLCTKCGTLKRLNDDIYSPLKNNYHCNILMEPLSSEQSFVAFHLESGERLNWFIKGGHIMKGNSRKKRWIPAIKSPEIDASIKEKASYVPKKPKSYKEQYVQQYNQIAEPYIKSNDEALQFLKKINAQKFFIDILFISLAGFRTDIYRFIREYDLGTKPKKFVEEFLIFLISKVQIRDKEIENEIRTLYKEKLIPERDSYPIDRTSKDVFRLKEFLKRSGVKIASDT